MKDWAGLAGNTLMAGVGQVSKASSSLFSAAEQMVSRPLGWLLGNPDLYKDAPLYQLDKAVDRDMAAVQENLAGSAEKTGKAGELIAKFGPATVAALPQAALAYLTAGQSLAAQGTTAGLQAASTAAQLTGGAATANAVLQAVQGMAKNPSFQYSFLNTVGGEYQQALEDGADAPTAYAYAALSSLANSMVEVGGGIDTLPEAVRGKSKGQLLEWVKSMFDEGKEEVVQGAISQMMQNGVYQKGRDYRTIVKDKGKNAAARAFAGTAVKILMGNFLLNRASEMLYGGTPAQGDVFGIIGNFVASGAGTTLNAVTISAMKKIINAGWEKVVGEKLFDDDDEEDEEERPFDLAEAAKSAGSDMLHDTPLAKNAGALFGIGDLSLPMPDLVKGVQRTADAAKEDGLFSHEVMRQLMGLAGDVVPGGRQAEKTFQGLDTALRGGRYSGYGEKEKLMYPVDEDPFTALRAALFGNSALEETGEYYASGNKALSVEQTKVYKDAVAAGGGRKDIYNAILDWRNINGDAELTSEEKARMGEEIVGETDLSDQDKLKFYKGLTGADSRADKLEKLLNAGMDWDGAIGAYAMYDEINRREGMTAGERATAFAKWADETYPAKQAGAVREQFVYYSMVPAQAGRYDKLTGAGLGTDTAYRLSEILGALEPETGKNQVSNMQKYQAIVSVGLSESDQLKAMEAVMSEGEYAKVRAGYEQGVTPELYVKAREAAAGYDANGNGAISQDEAKRAIKAMDGLTSEQRAALWQIQNKSWKPDNNPFNKKVGREVYQELNQEEEDEESSSRLPGLSLPSLR